MAELVVVQEDPIVKIVGALLLIDGIRSLVTGNKQTIRYVESAVGLVLVM